MGSGLSMMSRAEVTTRYAKAFKAADKRTKGRILDEVTSVTGWSRDNARRRLSGAARRPPGAGRRVAARPRRQRADKYSYDALRVLQRVWAVSGGQCGKYLAASMRMQLDGLERHGELIDGDGRYSAIGAGGAAVDVPGHDRPLPAAGEGHRPDQGRLDHETFAAAAVLDQDPQGRGRGGGRAGVLRGRHRGALRADPEGRVR